MAQGSGLLYYSGHVKCVACGVKISYAEYVAQKNNDYLVCQSFECRQVMDQKSNMPPLMFQFRLDFHRKLVSERNEKEKQRKQYLMEVKEKEKVENEAILRHIQNGGYRSKEQMMCVLNIPSDLSKVVFLSDKRRDNYKKHLQDVINRAFKTTGGDATMDIQHREAWEKLAKVERRFSQNPTLKTISDKICGMCKGGCCSSGSNHAYLSEFTIKNYIKAHPQATPDEILNAYLSSLPAESIENSCINQSANGCVLPKNMRSDICNGFYCHTLESYQKQMTESAELSSIIAVQRSYTQWNRYEPGVAADIVNIALVDEDQCQAIEIDEICPATAHSR